MQSSPDIEHASRKLANLSVSQRSPLEEVSKKDKERAMSTYSSSSSCSDQLSINKSVKTSGSESEHEQEDKIRFNKLVKKAKCLAQDGHISKALELNRQALAIHYHEKLARRIAKMEEYLKNYGDDENQEIDDNMVEVGSGFYLYKDLHAKLYQHQKEGVLWLWDLHQKNKGGILGDDMGLGKTIQVIAFLSGLFDMGKLKHVLIVVPVSVIVNWEKEFSKWAPGISVHAFHGNSKRERERALERVRCRDGVLLTTYGMVVTSWEQLASKDGRDFFWDYVILDEGHKIKNPTKTTKGINAVGAKHRIILTGTPIQNNLKELWTLFDYVHQGSLLGTLRTFKMEFENPIIRARERDATGGEKRLGMEMANILKKIINPFFLRRTKAQVSQKEKDGERNGNDSSKKSLRMPTMKYKNDFVIWLFLSDTQIKIYQDFLELESVKELLMTSKSPLVALTVLKKICDHPRLLSLRACHQLGLHGHSMNEDELELPSSLESAVTKIEELSDAILVGESGKMGVLITLLDQLKNDGHRSLVFSQSRKMLDIIQKVLRKRGHKIMRLDGTITHVSERHSRVQKFQEDESYSVFLLTTQVGGVGLTLTGADRVVIYDPSWNPATDAQAVDRVFRIGQMRNVVVYRLITCGTVEEKIYRRQIFKDSITRQTTGNAQNPYRYFTKQELRELFQLGDTHSSSTQQQLEEMHGMDRRRDPELDEHIAFLYSLNIFGISDHDLMFSQELDHEEEFEDGVMPTMDPHNQEYIQHRAQKAQEIIQRESSIPGTMEQRMAAFSINSASQHHGISNVPPASKSDLRTVNSHPSATTNLHVFIPKPADTHRSMTNRLPDKKKPEPVKTDIAIKTESSQPQNPVKSRAEKHSSFPEVYSSLKDVSDDVVEVAVATMVPEVIDLTEEEESEQSCQTESKQPDKPKPGRIQEAAVDVQDQVTVMQNLSLEDNLSVNHNSYVSPSPPAQHHQPPTAAKRLMTPGRNHQRIVEEELIISPTAYTPLMETRKKRQRILPEGSSPVAILSRTLAFSSQEDAITNAKEAPLVLESPDSKISSYSGNSSKGSSCQKSEGEGADSQDELHSFLDKEDRSCIEDSFVTEEVADKTPGTHSDGEPLGSVTGTPIHPDGDLSPDVGMRSHRRRSVCRRIARIESSEEEEEEEENKENIHPAYSSLVQKPANDRNDDNGDSGDDDDDDKHNDNEEGGDDLFQEDSESEGEEGVAGTGVEEVKEETEGSVEVYDESIAESDHDQDQKGDSEDESGDESVDVERLQMLLHEGKLLYRQKRYSEAFQYVQEALDMVDDPHLQALAEKIQSKIDAGL